MARNVVFDLMVVRALAQEALGQRADLHDFLVGLTARLGCPVKVNGQKSATLFAVIPAHAERHVVSVLRRDYGARQDQAVWATRLAIRRLVGNSGMVAAPPQPRRTWSPYNTGAEDHQVLLTAVAVRGALVTSDVNLRRWAAREHLPAFSPEGLLAAVEPDFGSL